MHTNLEQIIAKDSLNRENTNETIEQNVDIIPLTKLKKPRSEKQLKNDKKLGQRLRDKKLLKEQQQQQQQPIQQKVVEIPVDSEVLVIQEALQEVDLNVKIPVVKLPRPRLKRSKTERNIKFNNVVEVCN